MVDPDRILRTATTRQRRRGWTPRRQERYEALLNRFGVVASDLSSPSTWNAAVVEVGAGHGETTLASAAANPMVHHVAVDLHAPALSVLLDDIAQCGRTNISVIEADARDVMAYIPDGSLAEVRVLFPDPWPKVRHHHRRLIDAEFWAVVAARVQPGGRLHIATDIESYARAIEAVATTDTMMTGGRITRPLWRIATRYEQRAREAGRDVVELAYVRTP